MTYSELFDSLPESRRQELIDTYLAPGRGQPPARLESLTKEDKAWLARHYKADMILMQRCGRCGQVWERCDCGDERIYRGRA